MEEIRPTDRETRHRRSAKARELGHLGIVGGIFDTKGSET